MIRYGLIIEENKTYRHHAHWESDNYSRTYLYFVDNEKKIIDYCEKMESKNMKFQKENKTLVSCLTL